MSGVREDSSTVNGPTCANRGNGAAAAMTTWMFTGNSDGTMAVAMRVASSAATVLEIRVSIVNAIAAVGVPAIATDASGSANGLRTVASTATMPGRVPRLCAMAAASRASTRSCSSCGVAMIESGSAHAAKPQAIMIAIAAHPLRCTARR